MRGKLAIRAGNKDEIINEAGQKKKPSAVSGTSFVWPIHSCSTNPIFCLFTGKPGHASEPTTKHRRPLVVARNMAFCRSHRTSNDTQNRVGLGGVMIHIESRAKSNIHEKMTHMFDLAQDSI